MNRLAFWTSWLAVAAVAAAGPALAAESTPAQPAVAVPSVVVPVPVPAPPAVARPAETPAPAPATASSDQPPQQPQPQSAPTASSAAPTYQSIMLWSEDVKAIRQAIEEHDHPPATDLAQKAVTDAANAAATEAARPRRPNVYVQAVLDFGGGSWTVWANGIRITQNQQSPLFRVVGVRGDVVDIVVPGDGGGRFQLRPYQTWRSRQQDIVEGIVP